MQPIGHRMTGVAAGIAVYAKPSNETFMVDHERILLMFRHRLIRTGVDPTNNWGASSYFLRIINFTRVLPFSQFILASVGVPARPLLAAASNRR